MLMVPLRSEGRQVHRSKFYVSRHACNRVTQLSSNIYPFLHFTAALVGASDLYSRGDRFEFLPRHCLFCLKMFVVSSYLEGESWDSTLNKPWPLPSTSFPLNYHYHPTASVV
jgi:hypothetical protein